MGLDDLQDAQFLDSVRIVAPLASLGQGPPEILETVSWFTSQLVPVVQSGPNLDRRSEPTDRVWD